MGIKWDKWGHALSKYQLSLLTKVLGGVYRIRNCGNGKARANPREYQITESFNYNTIFERDFLHCSNPCLVPETLPFPLLSLSGYSAPACTPHTVMGNCSFRPAPVQLCWKVSLYAESKPNLLELQVLEWSSPQLVLSTLNYPGFPNYSSKNLSSNHITTLVLLLLDQWFSTGVTHLETF